MSPTAHASFEQRWIVDGLFLSCKQKSGLISSETQSRSYFYLSPFYTRSDEMVQDTNIIERGKKSVTTRGCSGVSIGVRYSLWIWLGLLSPHFIGLRYYVSIDHVRERHETPVFSHDELSAVYSVRCDNFSRLLHLSQFLMLSLAWCRQWLRLD